MMARFLLLMSMCAAVCCVASDIDALASTNRLLVSQIERTVAWRRQPVLATGDGTVVDASGVLVSSARAAALSYAVSNVSTVALAASASMSNAVGALVSSTNAIPARALHYALHLRPQSASNIFGVVLQEWSDGTNDYQSVYYNRTLYYPPRRFIEYVSPGLTNVVEVVWDKPWDPDGVVALWQPGSQLPRAGVHSCSVQRPRHLWGLPCHTQPVERWGSASGFSFGAFEVAVDGCLAWTGVLTNRVTGDIIEFNKGVLCD